jgi:hypothetical protein
MLILVIFKRVIGIITVVRIITVDIGIWIYYAIRVPIWLIRIGIVIWENRPVIDYRSIIVGENRVIIACITEEKW